MPIRKPVDLADRALGAVAAPTFPIYVGLAAAYAVFRAGGFPNIAVAVTDTPSYEETASHALWSVSFLGGVRSFSVPLVYKAIATPDGRIVAQLVISTLCWLVLAAAVARSVYHPLVRPLAFASVLAFSLTREVTMWDNLLLSESLTFGLMALAVGCFAVFAASLASAESGQRWLLPVKDVVFRRVIETPDQSRYFAEQGHPVEGNWTVEPWLERARAIYAGYLLRHPSYTLTAPFHGRQEAPDSTPDNRTALFAPDLGNYSTHEGLGFMRPPATLGDVFSPRDLTVLFAAVAAIVALAAVVAVGLRPEPVWLVPAGILLTAYPHLLVVWHFSGYEVDRHALQAALLLRLAALLLLLFAVDRALVALRARRTAS